MLLATTSQKTTIKFQFSAFLSSVQQHACNSLTEGEDFLVADSGKVNPVPKSRFRSFAVTVGWLWKWALSGSSWVVVSVARSMGTPKTTPASHKKQAYGTDVMWTRSRKWCDNKNHVTRLRSGGKKRPLRFALALGFSIYSRGKTAKIKHPTLWGVCVEIFISSPFIALVIAFSL